MVHISIPQTRSNVSLIIPTNSPSLDFYSLISSIQQYLTLSVISPSTYQLSHSIMHNKTFNWCYKWYFYPFLASVWLGMSLVSLIRYISLILILLMQPNNITKLRHHMTIWFKNDIFKLRQIFNLHTTVSFPLGHTKRTSTTQVQISLY